MEIVSDVPLEIVDAIFYNLQHDLRSVRSICLISRRFWNDFRKVLYRRIALSDNDDVLFNCFIVGSEKRTPFFTTLSTHNPSLARLLHTFLFDFSRFTASNEDIDLVSKSLSSCLKLLSNVTDLSILSSPHPIVLGDCALLRSCTFQLQAFRWISIESVSATDLYEFLTMQKQLQRLTFIAERLSGSLPLPNTCCPELRDLFAGGQLIQRLLPNRSITHLGSTPGIPREIRIGPEMRQKLEEIHTFRISGIPGTALLSCLGPLTSCLRSLQIVHIVGVTVPDILRKNQAVVMALPTLKIFIQSLPNRPNFLLPRSEPKNYQTSYGVLFEEWFDALKNLQVAYVQGYARSNGHKCYLAWKRDAPDPIWVEAAEIWDISPWI
ncbi:hypothetical protein AN958_04317 [Leucoagaricus sp. SymC.cos]|nr:hypothetical protein AN958_04317 [Leucoagaricus sp. SymC.cos]